MTRTMKKKELSPKEKQRTAALAACESLSHSEAVMEKLKSALVPEEDQPYKVPENWCWTKIGILSSLYRGVSYKKNDAHFIKQENDCLVMRGGNIGEGFIDIDADNVYVNASLVNVEQLIRKNDIIIVASTGSKKVIGRAGISISDYKDVAFGAFLILIRPNEKSNPKFLDYYFQSDLYRNRIRELASGVNINNIRADYITESPIPLPPLPEQHRIVTLIESLFADLDEAKEKLTSVAEGFAQRKAAILHQAFTGELTAKWREENGAGLDNWENCLIEDVFDMKAGKNIKAKEISSAQDDEHRYPCFGGNGIRGYVSTFNESGEFPIIGRQGALCVNVHLATGDFYATEHAVVVKQRRKTVPMFATLYLSFLNLNQYATAVAQPGLAVSKIGKVPIKYIPFNEQQEIVRLLDEIFEQEQQAQSAVESVLADIDTLKKSILARAFRGELGTNEPGEENAREMLKRVL